MSTKEIAAIAITYLDGGAGYKVDRDGVTKILATDKPGTWGLIPYVQVWIGERLLAEFCVHNIVGVYFKDQSVRAEDKYIPKR